jgi:hypothetical protein
MTSQTACRTSSTTPSGSNAISPVSFERSEWARDAIERCIKRVCEAAHRVAIALRS